MGESGILVAIMIVIYVVAVSMCIGYMLRERWKASRKVHLYVVKDEDDRDT